MMAGDESDAMPISDTMNDIKQTEFIEAAASSITAAAAAIITFNAKESEMPSTHCKDDHVVADAVAALDGAKNAEAVPSAGRWRRGSLSLPLGNDDTEPSHYTPSPLNKQQSQIDSSENVANNAQSRGTETESGEHENKRIVSPRAAAALAAARNAKQNDTRTTDTQLDEQAYTYTPTSNSETSASHEYSSSDELRSSQQGLHRNRPHHAAAFRRRFASPPSTPANDSPHGSPSVSPASIQYQSSLREPMLTIESRFSPTDRPRSSWNSDGPHHISPPSRPPSIRRHHRSRSFSQTYLSSVLGSPKTHPATTRPASGSVHDDDQVLGGGGLFRQESLSSSVHSPPPQSPSVTTTQTQQQQQQQQTPQPIVDLRKRLVRSSTTLDSLSGMCELTSTRRNSDIGLTSRSSSSNSSNPSPFTPRPQSPSASSEEAEEKASSGGGALDDERLQNDLNDRVINGSIADAEPSLGLGHLPEWIHHNTITQRRNSFAMKGAAPSRRPPFTRANSMGNVPNTNFGSLGFSPSSASSSSSSSTSFHNNNNGLGLGQQNSSNQFSSGSSPPHNPALSGRRCSTSVLETGINRSPRKYTAFSKLDESGPSTSFDQQPSPASPPSFPLMSTTSPLAAHQQPRPGFGNPFARSASLSRPSTVGGPLPQAGSIKESHRSANPFTRSSHNNKESNCNTNGMGRNGLPPTYSSARKGPSTGMLRRSQSTQDAYGDADKDFGDSSASAKVAEVNAKNQVYEFALWRNALGSRPAMQGNNSEGANVGNNMAVNNNVSNNQGDKFMQNIDDLRAAYDSADNNNKSSVKEDHGEMVEVPPHHPHVSRLARYSSAPSSGVEGPRSMASGEGLAAAAGTSSWTQSHEALSSLTSTTAGGNDNSSISPRLVSPTSLNNLVRSSRSSSATVLTRASSINSTSTLTSMPEESDSGDMSPVIASATTAASATSSGYRRSMSIDTSARATGVATMSRQHLLQQPTTGSPRTRARKHSIYDPHSTSTNTTNVFQPTQGLTSPPSQQPPQQQQQQQQEGASSSQSHGSRVSPGGTQTSPAFEWRRGEQLGRGTFGMVYLALNQNTGGLFAVKQVPILSSTPLVGGKQGHVNLESVQRENKQIEALQKEIDVMRKLEHPHIVSYISSEWDKQGSVFNIFLEFVPGGSLSSMLTHFGPLEDRIVRLYTNHIVSGVQYLHSKGIAHRDIKGANVLVNDHGIVKLADFGCSKQFAGMQNSSLGASGLAVKGSIPWMAPEVVEQSSHGRKSDIWSIGCTVLEMMTAKLPWPDYDNAFSILFQLAKKNTPPIPEFASDDAKDFLRLCLEINPVARPTAGDLSTHMFLTANTT